MSRFEVASPVQVPRLLAFTSASHPSREECDVYETPQSRISPSVPSHDLAPHYVRVLLPGYRTTSTNKDGSLGGYVGQGPDENKRFHLTDWDYAITPLGTRLSVVLVLIGQATADEQVSLLFFPLRLLSRTCGIREDRQSRPKASRLYGYFGS
jgi:hypothetical protein